MEDIENQNSQNSSNKFEEKNNNFETNNKVCCGMEVFTFECMKFFVCVIISFASMAFGMYLIIHDEFKTVAISAFATSLITNVFSFWVSPPEVKPDTSKRG